jgi:hypothetical protein
MKLIDEWKKIVKKAWSFRLMVLAGILSTAELVLPMFAAEMPRAWFAGLSLLAITGAMVARIVAQKEFQTND